MRPTPPGGRQEGYTTRGAGAGSLRKASPGLTHGLAQALQAEEDADSTFCLASDSLSEQVSRAGGQLGDSWGTGPGRGSPQPRQACPQGQETPELGLRPAGSKARESGSLPQQALVSKERGTDWIPDQQALLGWRRPCCLTQVWPSKAPEAPQSPRALLRLNSQNTLKATPSTLAL